MPADPVIPAPPARPGALQGTVSAADAVARVKYSHDAMIDFMIANPAITQNALAAHFGYSPNWVSRVINSDAFQARLAERKTDLIDPTVRLTFDEKLRAAADQSLEIITARLATTKDANLAVKALEISAKALGYGVRAANVAIQQNYVVAMPTKAPSSEEWAASCQGTPLAGGHLSLGAGGSSQVVDVESKISATPLFTATA